MLDVWWDSSSSITVEQLVVRLSLAANHPIYLKSYSKSKHSIHQIRVVSSRIFSMLVPIQLQLPLTLFLLVILPSILKVIIILILLLVLQSIKKKSIQQQQQQQQQQLDIRIVLTIVSPKLSHRIVIGIVVVEVVVY